MKQSDEHNVCEGTVVGFKAGKYTISYKDNTTATLTKTALVKTLLPPSAGQSVQGVQKAVAISNVSN